MAKWSEVKVDKESTRVVSHVQIEETDPKVYKKRAEEFAAKKLYILAMDEYDKAIRYSGNKLSYYFGKLFFCLDHGRLGTAFVVFITILLKKLRFVACFAAGLFFSELYYSLDIYIDLGLPVDLSELFLILGALDLALIILKVFKIDILGRIIIIGAFVISPGLGIIAFFVWRHRDKLLNI